MIAACVPASSYRRSATSCWCCWRCSARRNCIDGTVPSIMVDLVPARRGPIRDPPKPEKDKPAAWDLPGEQSAPQPRRAARPGASDRRSRRRTTAGRRCSSRRRHPGPAAAPGAPDQSPRSSIRPRSRCCSICRTCRAGISTPNPPPSRICPTMSGRPSGRNCASAGSCRAPHRSTRRRAWCCGSICAATRRLAGDPVLIEASASRDGPVVMQAAMRALKDCQPFAFLPADKYGEWKVLDLSFTPRDMAGG